MAQLRSGPDHRLRGRIANLTWMSPQTKDKALTKLATLEIGIGYPDTWIDYSTLDIIRGTFEM